MPWTECHSAAGDDSVEVRADCASRAAPSSLPSFSAHGSLFVLRMICVPPLTSAPTYLAFARVRLACLLRRVRSWSGSLLRRPTSTQPTMLGSCRCT